MYFLISDSVLLEIVKTVGIIATTILSTIGIYLGTRARKEQKDLSLKVDGRLTDLLEETRKSHLEIGHREGVAEQKAETKALQVTTPAAAPIELKIGKLEVELKPTIPPSEQPPITPPEEKK